MKKQMNITLRLISEGTHSSDDGKIIIREIGEYVQLDCYSVQSGRTYPLMWRKDGQFFQYTSESLIMEADMVFSDGVCTGVRLVAIKLQD